ncbi:MAG: DUF4410 domain-containing protein [Verrucomicrobiia bacterium]
MTRTIVPCLIALILLAGCASTEVTNEVTPATGQLPWPGNILVYDFAATAADVPADSALVGRPDLDHTPQTARQIGEGRLLGIEIAAELVGQIHALGMPAQRAPAGTKPELNDLVIRGYLLSINEGNATKRVTVGFGYGASELRTAVEVQQMTAHGLRKLESSTMDSGGGKSPGASLGAAAFLVTANPLGLIVTGGMHVYGEESGSSKVEGRADATAREIAGRLKLTFQEQGWIK